MSNVLPGDLAYVVVPPGFKRMLEGKFVDVRRFGPDDMVQGYTADRAARYPQQLWHCTFHVPFLLDGDLICATYLLDSWLRPIRANGTEEDEFVQAEQPDAVGA